MRGDHGARAYRHDDEDAAERAAVAHRLDERGHHCGDRYHGDGGSAHRELHYHRDEERDYDAEARGEKAGGRVRYRKQAQYRAEGAARARDGDYRRGVADALRDPFERVFLLALRNERHSEEYAEHERDDGVSYEVEELEGEALAERAARERDDGGDSYEDYRKEYRREAVEHAGELSVFLDELFHRVLRVGRDFDLAGDFARVEHRDGDAGDGEDEADDYREAEVRAEGSRHRYRSRGRRDEAVGRVKSAGERSSHDGERLVALRGERAAYRREDDEARVAEDRDSRHVAHRAHRQDAALLADDAEDAVRHRERRAGFLENRADYRSAEDDDTDVREDVAEAALYGVDDLHRVEAADEPHRYRDDDHHDERMDVELGNGDYHRHHGDKYNAEHE